MQRKLHTQELTQATKDVEIDIIRPPPPRVNRFAASLQQRNAPLVLTLNVESQSSTDVIARDGYFESKIPAQFTRM